MTAPRLIGRDREVGVLDELILSATSAAPAPGTAKWAASNQRELRSSTATR